MSFATDTFTGTTNQELSLYSAAWSKHTGYAQDGVIGVDSGTYAICNSNTLAAVYQNSGAPASADYSVFADLKKLTGANAPQLGVCGRMAAGADTRYAFLHLHGSNVSRLYKWVAGTQTQLGSDYANTLTSTAQRFELRMSGTSISGYIDGVLRVGPVTDVAISAAGKAGIHMFNMREVGVADAGSLDNFDAVDAGAGGGAYPVASNMHSFMGRAHYGIRR